MQDCARCPEHETTAQEGAATCVCEAAFYRMDTNSTCLRCPDGILCDTIGNELEDVTLADGMWRAGPHDNDFLPCPVDGTCIGGNISGRVMDRARGNSTGEEDIYCLTGNHGPLCAICDAGYSRWRNTVPCSKCPDDMAPSIIGAIGAAIGLLALLALCIFFNRRAPNGILRPVINAAQMMVVVMMFPVEWPKSIQELGQVFSGINLDFVQIASPACLGMPVSYYGRLASMVVITALVIGAPWLVSWLRYRRNAAKWADAVEKRMRDTFLLVVLLHPSVSGQAFYFFRCRLVDNKQLLMIDYSLTCYDATWYGMLGLVLPTILGFSLGMPLLFARLLWVRRSHLQDPATKTLLGVLYLSYKPRLYWFESVTMIFKLGLWATLVFFDHGSQFQLATSAAICWIQVSVHARFEPFEDRFKNILQYVSYMLVAFTAFSGLVINYIDVSLKLAYATFREAAVTRLKTQEQRFKVCTEIAIWFGTSIIVVQVLYYAVKFCRKHGAKVRRFGSRVKSAVTSLASRASSRPASKTDMELTMVQTVPRHGSANGEPEPATAPGPRNPMARI
eukprot:g3569.t1